MTDPDQDELVALRRRAYARDADIHLDPASLARLDELENARRPLVEEVSVPEAAAERPAAVEPVASDAGPEDPPPVPWWIAAARWLRPRVVRFGRWLRGLRRSTVLIALGAALIVATLMTVLMVVQRVQTDPLQLGAVQIARLSVDGGYENPFPDVFGPQGSGHEIRGYQAFHGLRAITGLQGFSPYSAESDADCLVIYVESSFHVQDGGFSGSLYSACAAGGFPPIVQLPIDYLELPAELAAAYPHARGVQFVYDSENHEVVVFADR